MSITASLSDVPRSRRTSARRQRGAALLTAMIIVTLVATLSASMVWQQWRAVQVESAERARRQSEWILTGALDWARLILREDGRSRGPAGQSVDHLGEPWAVPLAESRLSTFLAADPSATDIAPDAFLSGAITDLQALFNVWTLLKDDLTLDEEAVKAFGELCTAIGAAPALANQIALGLVAANSPQAVRDRAAPLQPQTVEQLTWLGIDADAVRALAPHVAMLPGFRTPVNVNTASREVLMSAIKGLDLGSAERLVQVRQRTPFVSLDDVTKRTQLTALDPKRVSVSSSFFQVRGRFRLEERVLELTSTLQRQSDGKTIILRRDRVSIREQAPS